MDAWKQFTKKIPTNEISKKVRNEYIQTADILITIIYYIVDRWIDKERLECIKIANNITTKDW